MNGGPSPARLRVAFSMGSLYGGGSERQLVQILQHLDRSRFEPLLYLVYRQGELLSQVPEDVPVTSFDTRTRAPALYWPGRMHSRRVRDFAAFLREQRIDLAYDRTFHMTMIAGPATERARVPRISTVVTDPARDFPQIAGRFQRLKWSLLRRAYLSAAHVVSVSDGVGQAAADFYRLPREQVTTIYNSVDLDRLTVEGGRDPFSAEPDAFRVVAAGRLHPQKGFDLLVRAASVLVRERGLSRLRVHILGDGPEESALRELIQSESVSEHVRLEGYRSDSADWLRHAHVYCLSSRYEGMPNALMEAMALETPVVATDCPYGPREILREGRFGALVPNEDVSALAAAIGGVHDHYEPMKQRAAQARERIVTDFALPAGVRRLEGLLEHVAAAAKRDR